MKPIQISKDVFPLGVFKTKASGILRQLHKSQRPIVITQNGNPAAVMLTPESYDALIDEEQFVLAVKQGLKDANDGRIIDDEELTDALNVEFGKLDEK